MWDHWSEGFWLRRGVPGKQDPCKQNPCALLSPRVPPLSEN